jgi:hypothetical protein
MSAKATLISIGPQPVDTTQNEIIALFQITFTGTYSSASNNGDVLSLVSGLLPSTRTPTQVDFFESPPTGTAPTGYTFYYQKGSNLSNGGVCIMQGASGAPNSQISQNASYPAALTGTTYIYGLATIPSY